MTLDSFYRTKLVPSTTIICSCSCACFISVSKQQSIVITEQASNIDTSKADMRKYALRKREKPKLVLAPAIPVPSSNTQERRENIIKKERVQRLKLAPPCAIEEERKSVGSSTQERRENRTKKERAQRLQLAPPCAIEEERKSVGSSAQKRRENIIKKERAQRLQLAPPCAIEGERKRVCGEIDSQVSGGLIGDDDAKKNEANNRHGAKTVKKGAMKLELAPLFFASEDQRRFARGDSKPEAGTTVIDDDDMFTPGAFNVVPGYQTQRRNLESSEPPHYFDDTGTLPVENTLPTVTKIQAPEDKLVEERNHNGSKRQRRNLLLLLGVIVITTATITPILMTRQQETSKEKISKIIKSEYSDSPHLIQDTPQNTAFNWLVEQNDIGITFEERKILVRYSLLTLFYSTEGVGWINQENWLDPNDECGWYGMKCMDDGEVVELDLSNNNLTGSIPGEIGGMTSLVGLHLSHNQLTSDVPSEIGMLQNLLRFDANKNKLASVPSDIGLLQSLTSLDLSQNHLETVSSEVGLLENLSSFWLYGNQLTGRLPTEVVELIQKNGRLSQQFGLSTLYLKTNGDDWTGKENWLESDNECNWYNVRCGNDDEIIELDLSNNNLVGSVPGEVGLLQSLTSLDLSQNHLEAVASEVGLLTNLSSIWLHEKLMTSPLPIEVVKLIKGIKEKQYPYYSDIILSRVPVSAPDLFTYGTSQYRAINHLVYGMIKNKYVELVESDFVYQYILSTLFFATKGDEWSSKTNWATSVNQCNWERVACAAGEVTELSLFNNNIGGTLPKEIGLLTNLTMLDFEDNELSGPIPTKIGLLTSLMRIRLASNQLSGSLPTEIGLLTSLTDLYLQDNKLSGSIPSELGLLRILTVLHLHDNKLSGSMPSEIGLLTKLERLYIENNKLNGSIPSMLHNNTWSELFPPIVDCGKVECAFCSDRAFNKCSN